MEFVTKLGKAKPQGDTLRTTVPKPLIQLWELEHGDEIEWEAEIKNDELIVKVKPVKKPEAPQ